MRQLQHGDVLIREVKSIPAKAARCVRREGKIVVAEGEATGHHHVIDSKAAEMFFVTSDGHRVCYLEVLEPVTITHEEHKPMTIPPGKYAVQQVREYIYILDMEQRVID
jgi:hypothetical protein